MKNFEEIYKLNLNDDLLEFNPNETFDDLINDFIKEYYDIQKFEEIYNNSKLNEAKSEYDPEAYLEMIKLSLDQLKTTRQRLYKQIQDKKIKWISNENKEKIIQFIKDTDNEVNKETSMIKIHSEKRKERDKLILMLKNNNLITDEDLK